MRGMIVNGSFHGLIKGFRDIDHLIVFGVDVRPLFGNSAVVECHLFQPSPRICHMGEGGSRGSIVLRG